MNVLVFSSEFPPGPGGIGTHAYELTRGLRKYAIDVSVLASQDYATEDEVAEFNAAQPFPVRTLSRKGGVGGTPVRLQELRDEVARAEADVVIATGLRSILLTSRLRDEIWVAIGHGKEFGQKGWRSWVTRRAYRHADAIVCVSNYTRARMRQMGISVDVEEVIPNGADVDRFHPLPRESVARWKERYELEGRILLTVGHVTDRKGQDVVVSALPEVLASGHDAHYVLVGLPTKADAITGLARSLGVEGRIHILGRIPSDELVEAYNGCDVYVMTSRHSAEGDFEGYGIAAVEAAMCGKPSVVSKGSGLEEAVLHDVTGLHVAENDPAGTARAISALLSDEAVRARLAAAARDRAVEEQTWEQVTERFAVLLRALIEGDG